MSPPSVALAPTPDVSLIKTLLQRAATSPDSTYVRDLEGRALSYADVVDQARLWAAAYRRLGVRPGDHVVTMQHNTIDSLLGWLGLAWLGAVETSINTDYRGALLAHALNTTRAPFMLVMEQYQGRLSEVADQLGHLQHVIVVDDDGSRCGSLATTGRSTFLDAVTPAYDLEPPRAWDIMAVLFTSGTTGPSKAVRLPWAQIHATATGTFPLNDLGPQDVIYNPGPTYHVGAKVFPYVAASVAAAM